jgi:hypothetical protein
MNCTFLTLAMHIVAGADLLVGKDIPDPFKLMFGELSTNVESREFNIEINPVAKGVGKNLIILNPAINFKIIGFEISN